jgi:plastocyanin
MTPRNRLLALLCASIPFAAVASAANFTITASGMSFSPETVTLHAGDSITVQNTGGTHNFTADDNSFRCAAGCDDQGGDGTPASGWTFTRTFPAVGTFPYHCEVHGFPGGGMHGTIVVEAGGGGGGGGTPHPGALGLSQASYTVTEGTAQAQITVARTGGADGAVSVHYATSGQSATAGSDFTSVSGALSWADHDGSSKTFAVPIVADNRPEPNKTVLLSLDTAAGGATLGRATAVLTILENDTGGPAPSAPAKLKSTLTGLDSVDLAWQDTSANEALFRIQARRLDETAFSDRGTVPANTTSFHVGGLDPATAYVFHVRAENAAGVSAFTSDLLASTDEAPSTCVADGNTLCLSGGRFRATIDWSTASSSGHAGAIPLPSNPDSGLFFFFGSDNIEALIKTLNACTLAQPHYWVFFAATTNVQFVVTVADTTSGKRRVYQNPLGQAALPVQDTGAFSTCP